MIAGAWQKLKGPLLFFVELLHFSFRKEKRKTKGNIELILIKMIRN